MKLHNPFWLLLIALLTIFASCKKDKTNNEDKLPPITQNGANTFGCLINGAVFIPKGYDGNFANSRITVDPGFADGDLTITVYKINNGVKLTMTITSDSIKNIGTFQIGKDSTTRAKFILQKRTIDFATNFCTVDPYSLSNITGFVRIIKYDLINRIFSGEFEINFNNADCGFGDPVKITQGRFDYKL